MNILTLQSNANGVLLHMTKKQKERGESDVEFMFKAYNLRRIINILGIDLLKKYPGSMLSNIPFIFWFFILILSPYSASKYLVKGMI